MGEYKEKMFSRHSRAAAPMNSQFEMGFTRPVLSHGRQYPSKEWGAVNQSKALTMACNICVSVEPPIYKLVCFLILIRETSLCSTRSLTQTPATGKIIRDFQMLSPKGDICITTPPAKSQGSL